MAAHARANPLARVWAIFALFLAMLVIGVGVPAQPAQADEIGTSGWEWPLGSSPTVVSGGEFLGNGCGTDSNGNYNGTALGGYGFYFNGLFHIGVDMSASVNTDVVAIGPGTVKGTWSNFGGDGGAVFIEHTAADGSKFVALYGHLKNYISSGTVQAGSFVGDVNTDHTHFGIHPGDYSSFPSGNWGTLSCATYWTSGSAPTSTNGFVDPIPYLNAHPAVLNTTGSVPAAYVDSTGTHHVFVRTSGGLNHYAKSSGGSWGGEVVATGTFTSAPAAYTDSAGGLHVYVMTSGGLNHYAKPSGGSWGGEVVATGTFTPNPGAYVDATGKHHVYIRTSGGINHYAKTTGSWGGEVVASGTFTASPTVYVDGTGKHHVYARTSGGINHYAKTTGSWGGEVVASGSFKSQPSAYVSGSTHHVYVRTSGGINHYAKSTGSWGGEVVTSGTFNSDLSTYMDSGGAQHVFVRTSGGLNHYTKSTGSWGGEVVTSGTFNSAPAAFAVSGTQHVYATTSGGLNHYAKPSGGSWGGEVVAGL